MIVGEYADITDMGSLFKKKKKKAPPPPAPAPEPTPAPEAAASVKAIKATDAGNQSFMSKYGSVLIVGSVTVSVVVAAAILLLRSPRPMAALPVSVVKKI